jgi:hypothetical protein
MRKLRESAILVWLALAAGLARADDHRTAHSIAEALEHPDEVQTLFLKGPVPREVERLPNLRALLAPGSLPDESLRLSRLTTLRLTGPKVTRLPDWIGSLGSLTTLELSRATITTLPPSIGQLGNLEQLILTDTKLESLPAEVGKLRKLKELRLTRVRALKFLPPELGGMASLEVLLADSSGLESVPPELGNLAHLRTADFSGTKLRSFPFDAFAKLPALEELSLGGNRLPFPAKLGALEGAGSSFRRPKSQPVAQGGAVPTDPTLIKARVLDLARRGARDELVGLLQALGLIPNEDPHRAGKVSTEDYVAEDTVVGADVFLADLVAEPPGTPAEKEAVFQVRTSGNPLTSNYYALGLFAKRDGKWKLVDTILEDGRNGGPSFSFKFVPVFKKEGTSAIQGTIEDTRLGGNERSEAKTVVIWKVTEAGATELAREVYSRYEYQSDTSKVRKDERGSFSLDIKPDSAQLVIKQQQGGKPQSRTVKLF